MRIIKKILRNLHRYVFAAFLSVIFWAWIFTFVTDTVRAKKVTLFVNVPKCECTELEELLDKERPEGIRMIKVHPFEYAAFLTDEVETCDIYILSETDVKNNIDRFCPIPSEFYGKYSFEVFTEGESVYAIKIYDAQAQKGVLCTFIDFVPSPESGLPNEDYYLCFNKTSVHLGTWNGSKDGAAVSVAELIMSIE